MAKSIITKLFISFLVLFATNSCKVEEGTSVDYILINESDYKITIERYGGWDFNFKDSNTVLLEKGSELKLQYSDDTGGPCQPFRGTDSLIFTFGDLFKKTYKQITPEKNPLRVDYYEGGKIGDKKHFTLYKYTYHILNNDL